MQRIIRDTQTRGLKKIQGVLFKKLARVLTIIQHNVAKHCVIPLNVKRHSIDIIRLSVPLQAWRGPEGSRKLRFPDYMTTVQDGGKVVSLTHRPLLPPGNAPGPHFH